MKFWKCLACARETVTDDNITSVVCLCGDYSSLIEKEGKEDEEKEK